MTIATLQKIERAQWRLMKAFDAASKAAPQDYELRTLRESATKQWNLWFTRIKAEQCRAGEKKDRGEVLFTIFSPDGAELRSLIRTPHRLIRRWERPPWYLKPEEAADHIEPKRKAEGAVWDFQYHMRTERERCEREAARNIKAAAA